MYFMLEAMSTASAYRLPMDTDLERAAELMRQAERIAVLTGAGISTESGIPDFRGPNGRWTKNPGAEKRATLQYYVSDPEVRKASWRDRIESNFFDAAPNAGHRALVDLERTGKLIAVITQNVDGLHIEAGSSAALVHELHGTVHRVKCLSCGEEAPMERALARVRAGEDDPACRTCGGILKSATISFGQNLEPDVVEAAERAALACDLMLAIGSTLAVYPAAALVPLAVRSGADLIIINEQETGYDDLAEVVLRRRIGTVLPSLVQALLQPHGN
jgi:NAD-dependent deacetylase